MRRVRLVTALACLSIVVRRERNRVSRGFHPAHRVCRCHIGFTRDIADDRKPEAIELLLTHRIETISEIHAMSLFFGTTARASVAVMSRCFAHIEFSLIAIFGFLFSIQFTLLGSDQFILLGYEYDQSEVLQNLSNDLPLLVFG